jgi:hypothetical protein
LLLLAQVPSAHAAEADPVVGRWQGPVVESSLPEAPPELRAEITISGQIVTARWTRLAGGEASARLEPGKRPAVLMEHERGLRAMFGRDRPVDPLQGQPLIWGRRSGPGVILYEFAIARDGDPTLDRYQLTPAAGGELQLQASRVGATGKTIGDLRALLRREGS